MSLLRKEEMQGFEPETVGWKECLVSCGDQEGQEARDCSSVLWPVILLSYDYCSVALVVELNQLATVVPGYYPIIRCGLK